MAKKAMSLLHLCILFVLLHISSTPLVVSERQEEGYDEKLCSLTSETPPPQPRGGWVFQASQKYYGYVFCDPFTGRDTYLPKPLIHNERYQPFAIAGFGWDPISEVYKLVLLSDDATHKLYYGIFVEVFDFGRGQWIATKWDLFNEGHQDPEVRAASIERFADRPNTYLNGSLHWMAYPYDNVEMMIVSFDLHEEKFERVPLPTGLDLDPVESRPEFRFTGFGIPNDWRKFEHYLLVLDERLSLVHHVDNEHVEVWVMEVYGLQSSWEKKYIVRNIVDDNGDTVKGPYKPIQLMENGEVLLSSSDQKLGYYHPVTQVFGPTPTDSKFGLPDSELVASFQ